jgi:hypothetical protein
VFVGSKRVPEKGRAYLPGESKMIYESTGIAIDLLNEYGGKGIRKGPEYS